MMRRFIFLALLSVALCLELSALELTAQFGNFIRNYDRHYSTVEETLQRYKIFADNYRRIVEHNAGESNFKLGVNNFADLTLEEYKELYLNYKPLSDPENPCKVPHKTGNAKTAIDWREKQAVSRVKQQGSCGSCWAFSTIGAIEGLHAIKKNSLVEFSEQELVDCSKVENAGCQGGIMEFAFDYIRQSGISKESEYRYEGRNGRCRKVSNSFQINGCVSVAESNNDQLLEAVNIGPVSVAVKANNYNFMFYKSGILDSYTAAKNELDHGITLVGASSENGVPYWIVKNSWGIGWGIKGYIHIKRSLGIGPSVCGIAEENSYPTL